MQPRERVEELVQSGIDEGAEVLCGARRPEGLDEGYFYEPTVLVGRNDMRIAREEIFGPVLTVVPYSGTDEEAVRLANDSIYGLGGGVVANQTARALNVARRIRVGSMSAQGVGDSPLAETGPGAGQGPAGCVRWVQAERHRARVGRPRLGEVHGGQVDLLELSRESPKAMRPTERRGVACTAGRDLPKDPAAGVPPAVHDSS